MTNSDQAVTKKCKPYKVDKQYINPMRLMFQARFTVQKKGRN